MGYIESSERIHSSFHGRGRYGVVVHVPSNTLPYFPCQTDLANLVLSDLASGEIAVRRSEEYFLTEWTLFTHSPWVQTTLFSFSMETWTNRFPSTCLFYREPRESYGYLQHSMSLSFDWAFSLTRGASVEANLSLFHCIIHVKQTSRHSVHHFNRAH